MKLFKMLKFATVVNNPRGSLGEEATAENVETTPEMDVSDNVEGTSDQPETESDPRAILDSMETPETGNVFESLNKLGLTHKGNMVSLESDDQVKELLSKGWDYTQKTQELSSMREQFETEMSQQKEAFESERQAFAEERAGLSQDILENQIFTSVIEELAQSDPTTFDIISQAYQQAVNQYNSAVNNPEFSAMKQTVEQLKGQLGQYQSQQFDKESADINAEFETGYESTISKYAPKLASYGIHPSREKVEAAWRADNTGTMTAEDALFAVYGKDIVAAQASAEKLAKTKLQSERRTGGNERKAETPNKEQSSVNRYEALKAKFSQGGYAS